MRWDEKCSIYVVNIGWGLSKPLHLWLQMDETRQTTTLIWSLRVIIKGSGSKRNTPWSHEVMDLYHVTVEKSCPTETVKAWGREREKERERKKTRPYWRGHLRCSKLFIDCYFKGLLKKILLVVIVLQTLAIGCRSIYLIFWRKPS